VRAVSFRAGPWRWVSGGKFSGRYEAAFSGCRRGYSDLRLPDRNRRGNWAGNQLWTHRGGQGL